MTGTHHGLVPFFAGVGATAAVVTAALAFASYLQSNPGTTGPPPAITPPTTEPESASSDTVPRTAPFDLGQSESESATEPLAQQTPPTTSLPSPVAIKRHAEGTADLRATVEPAHQFVKRDYQVAEARWSLLVDSVRFYAWLPKLGPADPDQVWLEVTFDSVDLVITEPPDGWPPTDYGDFKWVETLVSESASLVLPGGEVIQPLDLGATTLSFDDPLIFSVPDNLESAELILHPVFTWRYYDWFRAEYPDAGRGETGEIARYDLNFSS